MEFFVKTNKYPYQIKFWGYNSSLCDCDQWWVLGLKIIKNVAAVTN